MDKRLAQGATVRQCDVLTASRPDYHAYSTTRSRKYRRNYFLLRESSIAFHFTPNSVPLLTCCREILKAKLHETSSRWTALRRHQRLHSTQRRHVIRRLQRWWRNRVSDGSAAPQWRIVRLDVQRQQRQRRRRRRTAGNRHEFNCELMAFRSM